jgi:hypothetical protein
MIMNKELFFSLAICGGVTAITLWAQKSYWLGGNNFILLCVLAVIHIVISILFLWFIPAGNFLKIAVIVCLIVGQWWGIEFIAMIVIWKLKGFGP